MKGTQQKLVLETRQNYGAEKMPTRRFFIPIFLALILSASLALPSDALALRPTETVESGLEQELAQALGGRPSSSLADLRGLEMTGLEEPEEKPWYTRSANGRISSEAVRIGLDGIRQDLLSINTQLKVGQEFRPEDFDSKVIYRYMEAVEELNELLENGLNSPSELQERFYHLHRHLGWDIGGIQPGQYDEDRRAELSRIFEDLYTEEGQRRIQNDPLGAAAQVFANLVNLQGFSDGNKWAASLIMNYILLKMGYGPFILTPENALEYRRLTQPSDEDEEFKVDAERFRKFLEENVGLTTSGLEAEVQDVVFELWRSWDPKQALQDQSDEFHRVMDRLHEFGFRMGELERDHLETRQPGDWKDIPFGFIMKLRAGYDPALRDSLSLHLSFWGKHGALFHLLDNLSHYADARGLLLYREESGRPEEWILLDKGPGIPDKDQDGKPDVLNAIKEGVSLRQEGLTSGEGLAIALHWADGGSEVWSGSGEGLYGVVVSPEERDLMIDEGLTPDRSRLQTHPLEGVKGTLVFLRKMPGRPRFTTDAGLEEMPDWLFDRAEGLRGVVALVEPKVESPLETTPFPQILLGTLESEEYAELLNTYPSKLLLAQAIHDLLGTSSSTLVLSQDQALRIHLLSDVLAALASLIAREYLPGPEDVLSGLRAMVFLLDKTLTEEQGRPAQISPVERLPEEEILDFIGEVLNLIVEHQAQDQAGVEEGEASLDERARKIQKQLEQGELVSMPMVVGFLQEYYSKIFKGVGSHAFEELLELSQRTAIAMANGRNPDPKQVWEKVFSALKAAESLSKEEAGPFLEGSVERLRSELSNLESPSEEISVAEMLVPELLEELEEVLKASKLDWFSEVFAFLIERLKRDFTFEGAQDKGILARLVSIVVQVNLLPHFEASVDVSADALKSAEVELYALADEWAISEAKEPEEEVIQAQRNKYFERLRYLVAAEIRRSPQARSEDRVKQLQEGYAIVRGPWRNLSEIKRLQRGFPNLELSANTFGDRLLVAVGSEFRSAGRLSVFALNSLHTHGFTAGGQLEASAEDRTSASMNAKEGIGSFILAFGQQGQAELLEFNPSSKDWKRYTDQEAVTRRLTQAGFLLPQSGLEEWSLRVAAERWSGVMATPAYQDQAQTLLPVFTDAGTFPAIPLAARGGLPFLAFSRSGLEEQRLKDLLDDLNVDPQQYQIWRLDKMRAGLEQAMALARELFPSEGFKILPVKSTQPGWLKELLAGLEEAGVIPLDDISPAVEATQDYFRFV